MLQAQGPHVSTAGALAFAIGSVGDERILEPLQKLTMDPDAGRQARVFAAVSLGILARDDAMPWIRALTVGLNYRALTPPSATACAASWIPTDTRPEQPGCRDEDQSGRRLTVPERPEFR